MALRVAVFARKGGAGKTAMTALLARELARDGARVLVVDLDPQVVSVSTAFGVDTNKRLPYTPTDLVMGPESHVFAPHPVTARLDVIPGNQEQGAGLEHVLYDLFKRIRSQSPPGSKPRRAIFDARLSAVELEYDFVLLDCPTALGEVTSNALEAANLVVSPIDLKCRANVLSVTDLLQHAKALVRPPAIWFVGNKWVPRERQCRVALEDAQQLCGDRLFGTLVPETTAVSEALSEHREIRVGSAPAVQAAQAIWRLGQLVQDFAGREPSQVAAVAAVGGAI